VPALESTPIDYFDYALKCLREERSAEAAASFEGILFEDPTNVEAWIHRGIALQKMGNFFDAIVNYDKAIELNPYRPECYCNKGGAFMAFAQNYFRSNRHTQANKLLDLAMNCFAKSIHINETVPEAWLNIGNLHRIRGEIRLSIDAYKKAAELRSNYVDALLGQSISELELGEWDTAWDHYEIRWKSGQIFPRNFPFPQWEGEDLNGKSILIYAEQGYGDSINFACFVPELKRRYPEAIIDVEVRAPLVRLMGTLGGTRKIVTSGDKVGSYDYGSPMLSLARVLKIRPDNVPSQHSFLTAHPDHVKVWKDRIDADFKGYDHKNKLLVGICWSGLARQGNRGALEIDARRSTSLKQWASLGTVDNVLFVSLQKDGPVNEIRTPPFGMMISYYADGLNDGMDDFAETAGLVENLDMVISVDTAVVHLAAALGKPTWMLSRFDGCWRWLGDREDSVWYPTLRQFRQKRIGDWSDVMERVATELKGVVAGKSPIPWLDAAKAA
jgi:hypothetical protein